jgi:hypothetical protein
MKPTAIAYLALSKEERRKLGEKVFCATSRLAKLRSSRPNAIRYYPLKNRPKRA